MRRWSAVGAVFAAVFAAVLLAACAPTWQLAYRPDSAFTGPRLEADAFVSNDGARLALTRWDATGANAGRPWAVIIAVHGMNDYAGAFHLAAPWWASQGVTTLAYDQRGFGRSPGRGIWAPDELKVADLRCLVALARRRWPGAVIAVAGESLGGAVAIEAFASEDPPAADRLVLLAPAVWGWRSQPLLNRALLWLAARMAPGKVFTPPAWLTDHVLPSDNIPELIAMGRDPLMIWGARSDALYGLVTTMQCAQDETGRLRAPTLYLYGAHDPIIPRGAALKAVRALPPTARTAWYADGWHLLTRDREGPKVWADVLSFIRDPAAPLPSGAPPIPLDMRGHYTHSPIGHISPRTNTAHKSVKDIGPERPGAGDPAPNPGPVTTELSPGGAVAAARLLRIGRPSRSRPVCWASCSTTVLGVRRGGRPDPIPWYVIPMDQ